MIENVTNSSAAVLTVGATGGKSWTMYELIIVVIFVLGMGLFKQIVLSVRGFFGFLFQRQKQGQKQEERIADAALKILKEGVVQELPNPSPWTLQHFYKHIKDNAQNPSLDPLEVLNRMQIMRVTPDIQVYNLLLEACITSKRFQTAYHVFMELKEPGSLVGPDVTTYNVYMKGILDAINSGEHVNLTMIAELLKEMRSKDIRANVDTFNAILDICAITGSNDLAWDYFVQMRRDYGLAPDLTTFSTIIRGIRTNDKTATWLGLLFEPLLAFVAQNTDSVDDVLINGVIDACGKLDSVDRMEQFVALLKEHHRTLPLAAYGKLITIYAQLKKGSKIAELHEELKGVQPGANEVTYGCLMEGYLKCGMVDRVEALYEELQRGHKELCNIVIYTTFIRALAKDYQFEKAMHIYQQLKGEARCRPNRIAYNALLDCCVKCQQYGKMSEIFEDMLAAAALVPDPNDPNSPSPDLITYSTLIKGMCKANCMDKAMELYEEMVRKGLELDEVLFNSLLDGFAKSRGCVDHSARIIQDMTRLKIKLSNYTYSILVKLYAKKGEVDKALGLLAQMRQDGVQPGVIVYTCLIQTCIKHKRVDKALETYSDMLQSLVRPDAVTYNTIVNGCIFSGRLLSACQILQQAMSEGIRLADDIYNNVLRNFLMNHKMTFAQKHEHATKVCNYISVNKIPVSQEYLSQVLSSFVFVQQPLQPVQQVQGIPMAPGVQYYYPYGAPGYYPYPYYPSYYPPTTPSSVYPNYKPKYH